MQKIEKKAGVAARTKEVQSTLSNRSSSVTSRVATASTLEAASKTENFVRSLRSARQLSDKDLTIMINARG